MKTRRIHPPDSRKGRCIGVLRRVTFFSPPRSSESGRSSNESDGLRGRVGISGCIGIDASDDGGPVYLEDEASKATVTMGWSPRIERRSLHRPSEAIVVPVLTPARLRADAACREATEFTAARAPIA